MALNWNIANIKDCEDICWIPSEEEDKVQLNPVTECLIFATIPVKLGSITEENWPEFYARLHFCEKIDGEFLIDNGKPRFITKDEVKAHIGLTCNVANETRAQFVRGFQMTIDRIKIGAERDS